MSKKQETQKKKAKKEPFSFKQFGVTFILLVAAGLMILTLVPMGMGEVGGGKVENPKILTIGKETYSTGSDSAFYYVHQEQIATANDMYGDVADSDLLSRYAFSRAIEAMAFYGVMGQLSENFEIRPSTEFNQSYMAMYNVANPTDGFLDYVRMIHAVDSLSGVNGDIQNGTANASLTEAVVYFGLMSEFFYAKCEIAYFGVTNAISGLVSDEAASAYYEENYEDFVSIVSATDLMVTNKAFAKEISVYALSNGTDAALSEFAGQYEIAQVELSNVRGTMNRFEVLLTNTLKVSSAVYEKSMYHVLFDADFPTYDELSEDETETVKASYARKNFDSLYEANIEDLKTAIQTAGELAESGISMETAAETAGVEFVETAAYSPVDSYVLNQSEDDYVYVPVLADLDALDFAFTSSVGDVSPVFEKNGYYFVMKISDFDIPAEDDLDYDYFSDNYQDIYLSYLGFKNGEFDYNGIRQIDGAVFGSWYQAKKDEIGITVLNDDYDSVYGEDESETEEE